VKIIVPLAGPDVIHPRYGVRALYEVDGQPLLAAALESRPWMRPGEAGAEDLIFVLREGEGRDALAQFIGQRYGAARIVTLSQLTGGALYSALAGAALAAPTQPLCIDLVDILYRCDDWRLRAGEIALGGLVPVFESDDPSYSYLRAENGEIVEAAEKRVISREASAGTYFFKDVGVFLRAAGHSVRNAETLAFKGALFVCPAMNGVIDEGLRVATVAVSDVRPVGKLFH
jgi:hypothetical protein